MSLTETEQVDRILSEPAVHAITSLSRTTRWRLEQKDKFPKRRQLSARRVGWLESELNAWLAAREVV